MKFLIVLFGVFCCLNAQAQTNENEQDQTEIKKGKLKVSVYYETLCGDSIRFIKNQLYPTIMSLGGQSKVDIEMIPYGKATTTKNVDGSYQFKCQHDDGECQGNRMHSCALTYLTKTESLAFIHCSMSSKYPPGALDECSRQLNLLDQMPLIDTCSKAQEGDQLLARNGELTHELKPKLHFVPWITFNNVYEAENHWKSLKDFKTVLCNKDSDICENLPNYRGERRVKRESQNPAEVDELIAME